MSLLAEFLESERAEMMRNGIRLNAIGDLDRLPTDVREARLGARRDRPERGHDARSRSPTAGARRSWRRRAVPQSRRALSSARTTSRRRSGPPGSRSWTSSSGRAASAASRISSSGSARTRAPLLGGPLAGLPRPRALPRHRRLPASRAPLRPHGAPSSRAAHGEWARSTRRTARTSCSASRRRRCSSRSPSGSPISEGCRSRCSRAARPRSPRSSSWSCSAPSARPRSSGSRSPERSRSSPPGSRAGTSCPVVGARARGRDHPSVHAVGLPALAARGGAARHGGRRALLAVLRRAPRVGRRAAAALRRRLGDPRVRGDVGERHVRLLHRGMRSAGTSCSSESLRRRPGRASPAARWAASWARS